MAPQPVGPQGLLQRLLSSRAMLLQTGEISSSRVHWFACEFYIRRAHCSMSSEAVTQKNYSTKVGVTMIWKLLKLVELQVLSIKTRPLIKITAHTSSEPFGDC